MLHSICQQIWKIQQWPQDWKKSVFIPIPKKDNAKECSNHHTIALISHTSKVMLKILQARIQQYVTHDFQMFKLDLEKVAEPETELPAFAGSLKKQESSRKKHLLLLYWLQQSLWLCGLQQTGKFLKEMRIADHLTCLLRNLYTGQEAAVRAGQGTTGWFQIGKEVRQGCILSPCLFKFYAEYIRQNARLVEAQAGIASNTQMTPPLWQKVKSN